MKKCKDLPSFYYFYITAVMFCAVAIEDAALSLQHHIGNEEFVCAYRIIICSL